MRMGSMSLWLAPVWLFLATSTARAQQDPQEIRDHAADEVERAYNALRRHDTSVAVEALRKAAGLLGRLASGDMMEIEVGAGAGVMRQKDPFLQQLAFILEAAAMPTLGAEALGEAFGPEYERDLAAEEMKKLKEEAERLKAEQDQVTQEIDKLQRELQKELEKQAQEGEPDQTKAEARDGGEGEPGEGEEAATQAAARQAEVARNAARMADRIRETAGEGDVGAQEVADRFLAAAADARNAASLLRRTGVREQDLAAAHKSAERAGKQLGEALAGLKGMSKKEVNFLVDQVVAKLERILAEQSRLRARTDELAKAGRPEPATIRDVKALAPRQDGLRKAMESVESDLDVLRRWAEAEAKHETKQSILAAHNFARRSRIPQKMANAIVAYSEFDLRGASREQKKAEESVARILSKVQDAYTSMASDPASELKAAEIEARKIEENLGTLLGERKREGEGGEREPGEEVPPPLSASERRRLGEQTASRIGRLQRRVESRDFAVPEDDMRQLTSVLRGRPGELGRMADRKDAKLADLRGAAGRVHDKLEAEYESALNAKRLFQAQREECPPQYRPLVNRYFEVLSEITR